MESSCGTVLIFKPLWNVSLDMYPGAEVTIRRVIDLERLCVTDFRGFGTSPNLNSIGAHVF